MTRDFQLKKTEKKHTRPLSFLDFCKENKAYEKLQVALTLVRARVLE